MQVVIQSSGFLMKTQMQPPRISNKIERQLNSKPHDWFATVGRICLKGFRYLSICLEQNTVFRHVFEEHAFYTINQRTGSY